MTLGERISAGRRAAGISQEVLGERLGVSRQAISKWESDAAVPELGKLVALSKLFEISLGALLGVEEENPQPSAGEALSERELAAVEEIVGRYVSELEKRAPPKRIKGWQLAGIILGMLLLAWVAKGQVEGFSNRIQNVENNLWSVRNELSGQINSLTGQLADVIEQENSLVADWGFRLEEFDREAGTVTLALWATPKRVSEGMRAVFVAETPTGKPYTAAGEETPGRYTARIALPCDLEEELKLTVQFENGGERQIQLLETIWNLREMTSPGLWCSWDGSSGYQRNDGSFAFDGSAQVQIFRRSEQTAEPVSAQVELLQNGGVVHAEPVDLADMDHGGIDTEILLHQAVAVADGDALDLVLHVVDTFGRDQYFLAIGFDIRADERGWLDAAFYDMAQDAYNPVNRRK